MKKLGFLIAVLALIGFSAPSFAGDKEAKVEAPVEKKESIREMARGTAKRDCPIYASSVGKIPASTKKGDLMNDVKVSDDPQNTPEEKKGN